jgi:allantoinase
VSAYDLVLRSRRVVLPSGERPASVCVRDGAIDDIGPYERAPDSVLAEDLGDLALLPGLVDTHVHVNEPGRTEWEGFASATRAAAAGGVTTIIDMPLNSIPPTVTVAALTVKRRAAAGQCHVDVGFWGGAVPGNLADLVLLHEAGVFGFKAFLIDSGVPEFPPLDAAMLHAALREVPALFVVHAEDPALVTEAPSSRRCADFLGSRPPPAESSAIALAVDAARATGTRTHVLHLAAANALAQLARARAEGVPVSVETCPHYLLAASPLRTVRPVRAARRSARRPTGTRCGTASPTGPSTAWSPTTAVDTGAQRLDTGDFAAAWAASPRPAGPRRWSGTAASARGHSRRRGDVDGAAAGRPGRARAQGRIAGAPTLTWWRSISPNRSSILGAVGPSAPGDRDAGQALRGVVRRTGCGALRWTA